MHYFQVFSEVYKDVSGNKEGTFLIDKTVGRNAKFQMDFIPADRIQQVLFKFPNGEVFNYAAPSKSPFMQEFDFLEVH